MIDKKPGLIAKCVDTADVMASVNFVRENDLKLAVRGGGHNGGGLGSCDDGLLIDLGVPESDTHVISFWLSIGEHDSIVEETPHVLWLDVGEENVRVDR